MKIERYVDRHTFIVERVKGKRVLDFGVVGLTCESQQQRVAAFESGLHWKIAASADHATGVDSAAGAILELRRAYPGLTLVEGSIYDSERLLEGKCFDVIVLGDILEHLDNPGNALDAIVPLLVPNGEVIVSCPNAFGLPNYIRFVTGRFREGSDHSLSFNKFTISHLLERHGLRVVEIMTCLDRPPRTRAIRIATRYLGRFPELGGTLLILATRQG